MQQPLLIHRPKSKRTKEFAPSCPEEVSTIIIIIKWKWEIVLVDKRANATIHIIRQQNYVKGFEKRGHYVQNLFLFLSLFSMPPLQARGFILSLLEVLALYLTVQFYSIWVQGSRYCLFSMLVLSFGSSSLDSLHLWEENHDPRL